MFRRRLAKYKGEYIAGGAESRSMSSSPNDGGNKISLQFETMDLTDHQQFLKLQNSENQTINQNTSYRPVLVTKSHTSNETMEGFDKKSGKLSGDTIKRKSLKPENVSKLPSINLENSRVETSAILTTGSCETSTPIATDMPLKAVHNYDLETELYKFRCSEVENAFINSRWEDAVNCVREILNDLGIDKQRDTSLWQTRLAEAYEKQNKTDLCLEALRSVNTADLESSSQILVHFIRAKAYLTKGDLEAAKFNCGLGLAIGRNDTASTRRFDASLQLMIVILNAKGEQAGARFYTSRLPQDYKPDPELEQLVTNLKGSEISITQPIESGKLPSSTKMLKRFNLSFEDSQIHGAEPNMILAVEFALNNNDTQLARVLFSGISTLFKKNFKHIWLIACEL